tara:strand:+ start:763 stop:1107 length:345 start_codon:yes stop_codon:yes gene_type:complete
MKTYLLYNIEYRNASAVSGNPAYKLKFVDPDNQDVYICWVDTTNRNFTRCGWEQVLAASDPRGLYTGMKRRTKTHKGQLCLNADSKPVLIESWEQVVDRVFARNTFNTLFEVAE